MATVRNIAVVLKSQHNVLTQDNNIKRTVWALYSKAVDIWNCPRGINTLYQMMRFWIGLTTTVTNDQVERLMSIFLTKIAAISPLIVVDDTLSPSTQVIGMHNRGTWTGEFESFDPRKQSIIINKRWIDEISLELRRSAQDTTSGLPPLQRSTMFILAEFRVLTMFVHELGHLMITFLGHGEQRTPPRMRTLNPRIVDDEHGEAGEFVERGLFGGMVDFYRPSGTSDERSFPWIFHDRSGACRADVRSIIAIMRAHDLSRLPPGVPIIGMVGPTIPSREIANERFVIEGYERTSAIMSARARSENPLRSPSIGSATEGEDVPLDTLRQLTVRAI